MGDSWGLISSILALLLTVLTLLRDTFEVTLKWSESHNFLKRLVINRLFQLVILGLLLTVSLGALYNRVRSLEVALESQAQSFNTQNERINTIEASLTTVSSKMFLVQNSISTSQAQITQLDLNGLALSAKEIFSATTVTITNAKSLSLVQSSVVGKDFSVSARFFNPHDNKQKSWSYGFSFRQAGTSRYYLVIRSKGICVVGYTEKDKTNKYYPEKKVENLNVGAGMYNDVRLDVAGQRLKIKLNGVDIDIIDLDEPATSGRISLMAGYYSEDEDFEVVRVENFTISLP